MSRRTLALFCCLLTLSPAPAPAATAAVSVDERATRAALEGDAVRVSLAVRNASGARVQARVRVELVDPADSTLASAESSETIAPGPSTITALLGTVRLSDRDAYLWHRLRYNVRLASGHSAEGIVSLSEASKDAFRLLVAAPATHTREGRYRAHVLARHPVSGGPVEGVTLAARLLHDADDVELEGLRGRSDRDGHASFDFVLPKGSVEGDLRLEVAGTLGAQTDEVEERLEDLKGTARVIISPDKSLYQPGQTMHLRALAFDFTSRAIAGAAATLTIEDAGGEEVHRVGVTTTRFGVASADWSIPESAKLGRYSVSVEVDGVESEDTVGWAQVVVSRYDLPNFAVTTASDRTYYLPGQDAVVTVRADYLFGKPVARGSVRVAQEVERRWDYEKQKWEIEEARTFTGELSASGRFVVRIPLAGEHAELAGDDWSRFRDVTFAAYATDASTGRTEQRRFDLRVTREEIHIYASEPGSTKPGFPSVLYISTSYADGTPAACDVRVSRARPAARHGAEGPPDGEGEAVASVTTNRYGLARLSTVLVDEAEPEERSADLNLSARDAEGRTGRQAESLWLDPGPSLRIETDRTIYRRGEPVLVRLLSSEPAMDGVVRVSCGPTTVDSRRVRVRRSAVSLVLPYRDAFKGPVTIEVSAVGPRATGQVAAGRRVLFPADDELRVRVGNVRGEFRPGETVEAEVRVRTASGAAAESAVGVVVVDKAVEERARTDREFSGDGFLTTCETFDAVGAVRRSILGRLGGPAPSRPIPEGLDVAAEVLLNAGEDYYGLFRQSYRPGPDLPRLFSRSLDARTAPLRDALQARYERCGEFPEDRSALEEMLLEGGVRLREHLDPWGRPFSARFAVEKGMSVLSLVTSGPDERAGTDDDFVAWASARPYFEPTGKAVDRAVERYQERTRGFVRDAAALERALAEDGLDGAALRDRWGRPYELRFEVVAAGYVIRFVSAGPDGRFERHAWAGDDFAVWTTRTHYFSREGAAVDAALSAHAEAAGAIPRSESDLRVALAAGGIDLDALVDPWGRRYYASFGTESRYSDRITVRSYSEDQRERARRLEAVPVTRTFDVVRLRSAGPDGAAGTADDFTVGTYSLGVAERAGAQVEPAPAPSGGALFSGRSGAIRGTVTDPQGAVIPSAKVLAAHASTGHVFETTTDGEGGYSLRNVPAGTYEVTVESQGFTTHKIVDVPVRSSTATVVDVELTPCGTAETVMVTAGGEPIVDITSTKMVLEREKRSRTAVRVESAVATPRLREYFPETLVWRPHVETDAGGRATVAFKLADSVTTWKMSVLASTEDGRVGAAEAEIVAFQPFFLEHDPPKALTEGDEVALPVVLRNYLDAPLEVEVEVKPESWFVLTGAARQRTAIPAGDSASAIVPFRAVSSVDEGKHRVTALGRKASDAVEKPVFVHPDGLERAVSNTRVVRETASLRLDVPADAAGAPRAELKVYPNLMAHVAESVEAIMGRPYGCGEQTVSSAYPSVLLLEYVGERAEASLAAKARRYAELGYARLLGYRSADGGFSYWGDGRSDVALTAYALRFLLDAAEVVDVDPMVAAAARDWLVRQQRDDGSWPAPYAGGYGDPSALATAYVARVLAAAAREEGAPGSEAASAAVRRALAHLAAKACEADEPYLVASYALAAADAGEAASAAWAVGRLKGLEREEGGGSYWAIETNTPFYGWGLAGRVETTALAVLALSRAAAGDAEARALADRGLVFLLRAKDRYGVWHSTQATVAVLDAMLASLSGGRGAGADGGGAGEIEVFVGGARVAAVAVPPAAEVAAPVAVDLTGAIARGANEVEVRRRGGAATASVQAVASYYAPWGRPPASRGARGEETAGSLRFAVGFDRVEAAVGEEITCAVEAERVGSRGYGMLLGEVGLPPGVEVDRESLERAAAAGSGLCRYDVLPDRVVVYLWPRAGGTRFEFKVRPRYGISALAAPSRLFDYYNPEAEVSLAPPMFMVR